MVAAGIDYVTGLANKGIERIAINMSLGGHTSRPRSSRRRSTARSGGMIVVASAGNDGEEGMGWPGAYSQVISAGAAAGRRSG